MGALNAAGELTVAYVEGTAGTIPWGKTPETSAAEAAVPAAAAAAANVPAAAPAPGAVPAAAPVAAAEVGTVAPHRAGWW